MKWLVTGGSGFTGKYLIKTIHSQFPNDKIIVVDINHPQYKFMNDVKFIEANGLEEKRIGQILINEKPDRIIHLVGLRYNQDPLLMTKINVITCGILLETVKKKEIPIDGFLVVGSAAQYGEASPQRPPTEKISCVPSSYYGYLKLLQEKLALEYYQKYELPIICVRLANLIGPHMLESFVIPRIINQLAESRKNTLDVHELILHHTKAARDFIDVRDVSNAYIKLFINSKTRGEIFNLGRNEVITLMEVIEQIKNLFGIKHLNIIEKYPRVDIDQHLMDSTKIRNSIHWKPKFELETTLKDMIEATKKKLDYF